MLFLCREKDNFYFKQLKTLIFYPHENIVSFKFKVISTSDDVHRRILHRNDSASWREGALFNLIEKVQGLPAEC